MADDLNKLETPYNITEFHFRKAQFTVFGNITQIWPRIPKLSIYCRYDLELLPEFEIFVYYNKVWQYYIKIAIDYSVACTLSALNAKFGVWLGKRTITILTLVAMHNIG